MRSAARPSAQVSPEIEAPRNENWNPRRNPAVFDWGSHAWRPRPSGVGADPPNTRRKTVITREKSGRLDLNQRPLGPQPSALPDCATPRGWPDVTRAPQVCVENVTASGARASEVAGASARRALIDRAMKQCGRCGELKPLESLLGAGRQRDSGTTTAGRAIRRTSASTTWRISNATSSRRPSTRGRRASSKQPCSWSTSRSIPALTVVWPNPIVLEFDHLRDKSFAIGTALTRYGWDKILAEIAKCEVVCANCHRRRTARRRGAIRVLLAGE